MTPRKLNKDSAEKSERITVNKVLHLENVRLLADIGELRKENKIIPELRVQNERLKVRAEFSILGDVLLTVGSIGFGALGVNGQEMFSDHINFSICFGVALAAACIGLLLKSFVWFRR